MCPCTARELLGTWQRYQEQLGLVATYFMGILRAKDTVVTGTPGPVWASGAHLCANQELLSCLEEGHRAQGLEGFCPHVALYIQYAANAEGSWTTFQEQLRKSKHFWSPCGFRKAALALEAFSSRTCSFWPLEAPAI